MNDGDSVLVVGFGVGFCYGYRKYSGSGLFAGIALTSCGRSTEEQAKKKLEEMKRNKMMIPYGGWINLMGLWVFSGEGEG